MKGANDSQIYPNKKTLPVTYSERVYDLFTVAVKPKGICLSRSKNTKLY